MWQTLAQVSVLECFGPHTRECPTPSSLNNKENRLSHRKRIEKVDSSKVAFLVVVSCLQITVMSGLWVAFFGMSLVFSRFGQCGPNGGLFLHWSFFFISGGLLG